MLRRQAADLNASLVKAQNAQPLRAGLNPEPQPPETEEYPKTPEAATQGIFNSLVQGDMEKFFTNFGEPGVPKDVYDKLFNDDRVRGYLAGIDTVTVGEPTNSFSPGAYFVPYRIHFKDGTEKEMRLHVGQDPRSQKYYFKGGI
jgi:hypothetical protein